ncbi:hypothetical protein BH23VER1_BH23VER1_07760 [soil metagenome]
MTEIFNEAVSLYNLPLTIALGLVVGYWILVILGAIGMEAFDIDLGTEADIDVEVGAGGDVGGGAGGVGLAVLRFLNFGSVPAMVVISVLVTVAWAVAVVANLVLNPGGSLILAGVILLGDLVLSALVTKVATLPLKPLFRSLDEDGDTHLPIVGRTCVVRSMEVTTSGGQAEIEQEGATVLINVRVSSDERRLARGARALVAAHDEERDIYFIREDGLEAVAPDLAARSTETPTT